VWVWSDGSNYTYSDWGSGEPNNTGSDNCVQLYNSHSYKWNDAGCNYSCPFICYRKIPLILIKQEMTWRDALRYCRENHVDLVSVLTNETQEWVETVTKSVSTPNVWMGLRHTRTLGFWYWVSGELSGTRTGPLRTGQEWKTAAMERDQEQCSLEVSSGSACQILRNSTSSAPSSLS
ncbi:hypothetical protein P4O66_019975, partial [Electrophorus voltai]